VLRELRDRLLGRRAAGRADRESAEGRRLGAKRLEDQQADEFVEEHLGGIDPNRLLGQDEPPRE
jgi:hypothetical protein